MTRIQAIKNIISAYGTVDNELCCSREESEYLAKQLSETLEALGVTPEEIKESDIWLT
jgi:hypothetical protein